MGDGSGELDMAHALAPDLGEGDLDAAFFADDALVFHPLVLAAQALIVLHRAEHAGAEQPVPLRLEGAVVDRLRLLDLAERPGEDFLRRGDRDADLVESLRRRRRVEDVHDLLVHRVSAPCCGLPRDNYDWVCEFCSSTLRLSERISLTSTL